MHKFYILQNGEKTISEGTVNEKLFGKLRSAEIRRAVFLSSRDAVYFEILHGKAVMVGVDRNSAGFAKILARKLLGLHKKIDLKSMESVFEFAKKVENADLDELAKLR
ncbi:MAG: hypothetical protein QXR77_05825 [Archaeoglobaceae archaeon]